VTSNTEHFRSILVPLGRWSTVTVSPRCHPERSEGSTPMVLNPAEQILRSLHSPSFADSGQALRMTISNLSLLTSHFLLLTSNQSDFRYSTRSAFCCVGSVRPFLVS